MKFAYDGFDASGKPASGTVDAADRAEALEALRRQALFVTEVRANDAPGRSVSRFAPRRRRLGKGKKQKNLAMFMRQLSVLVSSGTQLIGALMSLEKQAREPAWRDVIASVRARVEEGSTLSAAMESHPDVFDAVCRSLIAAGESGGGFEAMLDRLSILTKKQVQIRAAVIGAMVYPALLIVIAVNVLFLMLLFVLPRFAGLFASLDVPLPPSTRFLMQLSGLLRSYWWALPIAPLAIYFAGRSWFTSAAGKRTMDTVVLKLPIFGNVIRSFAVARITRILGVLINGKVPLLEALALARQTMKNVNYVELVGRAEEAVTNGSTVSAVFSDSDLVNPSLAEAIKSGEQSGQMGALLLNISDFLDEENEVIIKSLTSILEPLILIVLGVVVGFIALSMFLPLFDLTSMANGGGGGGGG